MSDAGVDLNLEEWIDSIGGLTERGRKTLDKNAIVNLTCVKYLTEQDIEELQLAIGDRVVFRNGWQALRTPVVSPPREHKDSKEFVDSASKSQPLISGLAEDKLYSLKQICEYFGGLPCVPRWVDAQGASGALQQPSTSTSGTVPIAIQPPSGFGAAGVHEDSTVKTLAKYRILSHFIFHFWA